MAEIDPRLIAAAVREIRSVESETGESLSAEDAVQVVLGLFRWRDEFQSVYQDDVGPLRADPDGLGIYQSARDLAADMAKHDQSWRHMEHRFVASTDWERIEARLSWEPR